MANPVKFYEAALKAGKFLVPKHKLGWGIVGMNVGMPVVAGLFGHKSRSEKIKEIGIGVFSGLATASMGSVGRQMLWTTAIGQAASLPRHGRAFAQAYKTSIEARTMAAIPFSHSAAPMDMAAANLSYAQSRYQQMNSSVGQAAAFAARYTGHRF